LRAIRSNPRNISNFIAANLYSPLAVLELTTNRLRNFRLFNTAYLAWEPIKGLLLRSSGGLTLDSDDQFIYVPPTLAMDGNPTASLLNPVVERTYSSERTNRLTDWLWENTATYTRSFGKHSVSGLAGLTYQRFNSKYTQVEGRPGTYNTLLLANPFASPDLVGGLNYDANAFASVLGRVTYDYNQKYLFSAAVRQDASSKFGPNARLATFPSLSAGWRVSEEPFMKPVANLLSTLKLRASYGETGNANIGNYSWLNGSGINNAAYFFDNRRTFGAVQNGWPNANLTWEKNIQRDFGLEAGFLNDRYTLTVDYYDRRTTGMLFDKDLPGVVGVSSVIRTNLGEVQNTGWEFAASMRQNLGALRWTVDANLSTVRSKVLDLGGREALNPSDAVFGWANVYRLRVGEPIGQMYGYVVKGVFRTADELANNPKWASGNVVGDWIIEDTNKDGKIDINDTQVLGNGLPNLLYGLTSRFDYKGIDFSFLLQGVSGHSIANGNLRHPLAGYGNFNAPTYYVDNYFDPAIPTRDVQFPRLGAAAAPTPVNSLNTRNIENGSFMRVRNVTLGYTLPTGLLERVRVRSARLYVTGQNLLTFSDYSGFNPETSLFTGSIGQPGVDQGTYPANRSFIVGLNVGF
jgi:TonB-linked SusC/RagA family outer membrane protein